jgi:hypothetical protein
VIPSKENIMNRFTLSRRQQPVMRRPARARPVLELLEDRRVLNSYTAATAAELITDIRAANSAGGSNTITLAPNTTFDIDAADNTINGPNGLPVIAANTNLSILGQGGDIIQRHSSPVYFRLFDVARGGTLGLSQVTLQNGGSPASTTYPGRGGAIYNEGTLVLDEVTVASNYAAAGGGIWSSGTLTIRSGTLIGGNHASGSFEVSQSGRGGDGFGGGIWSSGTLTIEAGTLVQYNWAVGGNGVSKARGGDGFGGGLYIAGGTANLTDATVNNNTAVGGDGAGKGDSYTARGGDGYGGGLYAAAGSATLRGDSVQFNTASGGLGRWGYGTGYGGGLFIANKAALYLDASTLANTVNNTDSSGTNGITANIDGSYTILTQGAVNRAKPPGTVSTH